MTKEVNTYKVDKPSAKGVYLLQLESRGQKLYNQKIILF